jgi:hypothetical protein
MVTKYLLAGPGNDKYFSAESINRVSVSVQLLQPNKNKPKSKSTAGIGIVGGTKNPKRKTNTAHNKIQLNYFRKEVVTASKK